MIQLLLVLIVISAIVAAASFVLYARARMKEDNPKEKFYITIHYTSMTILCLLGIVYMFIMVNADN